MIFKQLTIDYIENKNGDINKYIIHHNHEYCVRCGQKFIDEYCHFCQEFGPVCRNTKFIQEKYMPYQISKSYYQLNINLTPLQCEASEFIIQNAYKQEVLVWAVCGSGKTEITFEIIRRELNQGNFIAFVIPRKDLLTEIANRLEEVFYGVDIVKLSSEHKTKRNGQLYVLTPNQLIRFKNAFSLVICDEVDAYPFMEDPRFIYAVETARREDSGTCFLTSTPSEEFLKRNLAIFTIYERWHQQPLPVPILIYQNKTLFKLKLINSKLKECLSNKRQILFFVGQISLGMKLEQKMKKWGYCCEFVHAQDERRSEKISRFRNRELEILISTTILERGVTFNGIDVIVIDSDCFTYNVAALVQIAGRVNRKLEDQNGKVYFCYEYMNETIENAVEQICEMNRKRDK